MPESEAGAFATAIASLLKSGAVTVNAARAARRGFPPAESLMRLSEGNARYMTGRTIQLPPRELRASRRDVAQDQHPFAIVFGCADSRVPPEIIFDAGLGDIFDVRTAGHTLDSMAMGSLEYGVRHLHCPLIVVLGHERCGAVTAAVEGTEPEPANIGSVIDAIKPAVQSGMSVEEAIRANALMVADALRTQSPILAEAIAAGELAIVAMRYDLDTGHAGILGA